MLEKTLARDGFGDVLAEGSARAAKAIGNGAEALSMTVKGSELPAHMPHLKRSLALIYAVNPFGADHQSSEHDTSYEPELLQTSPGKYRPRMAEIGLTDPQDPTVLNPEKVRFALTTQRAYAALDTENICQFVFGPGWQLMSMGELARVVTAVLGEERTVDDLLEIGARRLNLLRAFNAREGFTRAEDTLPRRLFDEPLEGGMSGGRTVGEDEWREALDEYHRQAGWDLETGAPTRETLEGLGLDWVADEIGAG
jgi:aldehyde:ferredoxin oxidoreductase